MLADPDTDELLAAVEQGDAHARGRLLERHRNRLRRMVALRLDGRLAARLDPSDVVQEALATAAVRLDDYVAVRPVPFYLWVRQIAWEHLVKTHQRHGAAKRAIGREEQLPLTDASVEQLAARLATSASSPSAQASRAERHVRVRAGLEQLAVADREVLILRHLEQLSTTETAAVLRCSEGAVKVRLLRALRRLRDLLEATSEGTP